MGFAVIATAMPHSKCYLGNNQDTDCKTNHINPSAQYTYLQFECFMGNYVFYILKIIVILFSVSVFSYMDIWDTEIGFY